ncbi:MAG: sarcosine oxidase subunit gamma family protein, partial [Gammaproteobacteria bacterium]
MSDIDYALMQQRPSVSFLEHSALTRADRSPISGSNPVMLREQPAGHLVLRGTPAEFSGAVRETLQLETPTLPLTSNTSDTGACIRWISPDEWLITVPEADTFEVESA